VKRVGQGGDAGRQPDADDCAHGPRQRRHGVGAQRVTDCHVPLHRERRDGKDRRGRRHLRQKSLQQTVRLAKAPRIGFPDRVQFRRQTWASVIAHEFGPISE